MDADFDLVRCVLSNACKMLARVHIEHQLSFGVFLKMDFLECHQCIQWCAVVSSSRRNSIHQNCLTAATQACVPHCNSNFEPGFRAQTYGKIIVTRNYQRNLSVSLQLLSCLQLDTANYIVLH